MTAGRRRCRRWSPLFRSLGGLMPRRRSTRQSRTRRRPWPGPRPPAGRPRAGEKPAWITLLGSWRMTWTLVRRARGAPGPDGLPLLRGQAAGAGQASGLSSAPGSRRHHRCGTAPGSHRLRWGSAILAQARTPVAYRSRPVRPGPVARAVDSPADKSAPRGTRHEAGYEVIDFVLPACDRHARYCWRREGECQGESVSRL